MKNIKTQQEKNTRISMLISIICLCVYIVSTIFITVCPQIFVEMSGYDFEEFEYKADVIFLVGRGFSIGIFLLLWLLLKNKLDKSKKSGRGFMALMWILIAVAHFIIPAVFNYISLRAYFYWNSQTATMIKSIMSQWYSRVSVNLLIGYVMLICAYLSYDFMNKYYMTGNDD